ncbi:MAG: hypothetical protein ORO03_06285 [Alphaproteobacteria bacterium]|nr:hypothetical protein [Alphaproteobacteria bacterium]
MILSGDSDRVRITARLRLVLSLGLFLGCAVGLSSLAATELATPEDRQPSFTKTKECNDSEVADFVGRNRLQVLREISAMATQSHGFASIRVLDGFAPVNYEVVPNRLTLVIRKDGVVSRAFCR